MDCRFDLLVVDLDGTLLSRDGSVSLANRRALDQARDSGMEVIIATGRSLNESKRAIEAVKHEGFVVAAGGSLMCDAVSGRTIDRRVIPADVIHDAAQHLVEHGHKVLILKDAHVTGYDYLAVGDGQLDPASQWWFEHLEVDVRFADCVHEDAHPEDSVRAGAVACEERLAPVAKRLREQMGERCFLQHWSAVTATHAIGSATHLLEIFMPNVNKWTMISAHCERRGIDPQRVAAIGDGLNDIELVQNAGLGIAMANCCPEVAAAARHTTADHDEDGVALAIRNILSGTW